MQAGSIFESWNLKTIEQSAGLWYNNTILFARGGGRIKSKQRQ